MKVSGCSWVCQARGYLRGCLSPVDPLTLLYAPRVVYPRREQAQSVEVPTTRALAYEQRASAFVLRRKGVRAASPVDLVVGVRPQLRGRIKLKSRFLVEFCGFAHRVASQANEGPVVVGLPTCCVRPSEALKRLTARGAVGNCGANVEPSWIFEAAVCRDADVEATVHSLGQAVSRFR